MSFSLDKVVPWGRSYAEYVAMFALSQEDLEKRILGCGDGPASFNAMLTQRGYGAGVISIDPIYCFSAEELNHQIKITRHLVIEQVKRNRHEFVWKTIKSIAELKYLRMSAMKAFLLDYTAGKEQGRYMAGELPALPWKGCEFDLALCSHLLFLYSEQLSFEFHMQSIQELCRVAKEVRIFPLLELGSRPSRHRARIVTILEQAGYRVSVETVPYEFQKGGNQMLRVEYV